MNDQRAREILRSLINAADPFTGRELPPGNTLLESVEVVRAMLAANVALEERITRETRRAQLPTNIGKDWTPDEHDRMVKAFNKGDTPEEIADAHGRTPRAIEARLELHGLITKGERKTQDRFSAGAGSSAKPAAGKKKGKRVAST